MSFHARRLTTATSFAALLVASGCGGPADEPAEPGWFVESAQARGIDVEWVSGHRERFYFPEIMGGGAALFDMDTDGDLDLYLVQAGRIDDPEDREPNRLFENAGPVEAGRFRDVTEGSGAEPAGT